MGCAASSNASLVERPTTTESGLDLLGVSVFHLRTVFMRKLRRAGLSRESKIYEIENLEGKPGVIRRQGAKVVCPVDGKLGAAYVHSISGDDHVGKANFMLSYGWGYKIGDIVDTLSGYCKRNSLDFKRTYIWICCLCVNQHRVVLQKANEKTGVVDFDAEFKERVLGIGHILAMMAPWDDPLYLKRVWCIFEIFTASQNDCQVTIVMPTEEERAMLNALTLGDKGIDKLYTALARTKIEDAEASVKKDRDRILGMVESTVGFAIVNQKVNVLLRKCFSDLLHYFVDKLAEKLPEDMYAPLCWRAGNIFYHNEELDVALEMHQKALDLFLRIYGKNHDSTEVCYSSIGDVLRDKGDYDKALKMCRESLEINLSIHSDKHPKTAESHHRIASVLQLQEDFEGAIAEYREALSIYEVYELLSGRRDREVAPLYSNFGSVLYKGGHFDEALVMYGRGLERHLLTSDELHPNAAAFYINIGAALLSKGNEDEALKHLYKGFDISLKLLGADHPQTKLACGFIKHVLVRQGKWE